MDPAVFVAVPVHLRRDMNRLTRWGRRLVWSQLFPLSDWISSGATTVMRMRNVSDDVANDRGHFLCDGLHALVVLLEKV